MPPLAKTNPSVHTQKFRLIIAEALALQYESVNEALAGSQRFQPSHSTGSEDKVPLSGEESEVLQNALAGFESFSAPAVLLPLRRLKGEWLSLGGSVFGCMWVFLFGEEGGESGVVMVHTDEKLVL